MNVLREPLLSLLPRTGDAMQSIEEALFRLSNRLTQKEPSKSAIGLLYAMRIDTCEFESGQLPCSAAGDQDGCWANIAMQQVRCHVQEAERLGQLAKDVCYIYGMRSRFPFLASRFEHVSTRYLLLVETCSASS